MKRLMTGLLTLTGLFVNAESSVWKVSKGGSVLYFGGTCHVLRKTDFPLPPEFEKAYKATTLTVFETDMGKLQEPEMQQVMMKKMVYDDGSTIEQHISAESYQLIQAYCSSNNLPLMMFKQLKPVMMMQGIMVMELMKVGMTQEGVDLLYHKQAKKDGKQMEGLETFEEQLDYVATMADGHEDAFVRHSLEDLSKTKELIETLVTAWRKGDDAALDAFMVTELKSRLPTLYKKLLTDRNDRWLPKVEAYLETPQSEFILVGVAHLVGPEGVLAALRKKGYQVEKL